MRGGVPSLFEVGIVVGALVVRLAVAAWMPDPGLHDAAAYALAGRQLLDGGGLELHNVMPLYPLLVALTGGGWGTRVLDALLSTGTVAVVGLLAGELVGGRWATRLAMGAAAVWPHALFHVAAGLTETLFTLLLVLGLWLWLRRQPLGGALCWALSVLVRPTFEPLYPVLVLVVAGVSLRLPPRKALAQLGIYAVVYVAVMAPWWVANHARYGAFVRTNAGAGLVLFYGNNPDNHTGGGFASDPDVDLAPFVVIDDPLARDRALREAAWTQVREHPGRFLAMAWVKLLRMWRPWPNSPDYRDPVAIAATLLSYGPALALALVATALHGRRRWRAWLPLWLGVGYLAAVHAATIASVRYRFPAEPLLIVLASGVGPRPGCPASIRHEGLDPGAPKR